ncbi:MAG: PaeR7I family type II restriction endonuclease [Conexibacter sp.]
MDLAAAMKAFRSRHPRASNRQEAIQLFCVAELERRGLRGSTIEVSMPGHYRDKKWDVGLVVGGEPRLAISCKSIVSNHAGTVPNRVDDMLGEAVSLHRAFPKAVLGYLFMMSRRDESVATGKRTERMGGLTPVRRQQLHMDADRWFERLVESVSRASERRDEDDLPEKFEVVSCSQIDFDSDPYGVVVHDGALGPDAFFDRLVEMYRERY